MSIVGEVDRGSDRRPQRPLEEFQTIVAAALESDGVAWFAWNQFTPYFSDGDPCVFHCYGLGTVEVDGHEVEDFPGYGPEDEAVLGKRPSEWINRERVWGDYTGPNESRYDALSALNDALGGGEFEDVLLSLFGDHAEVRVVKGDAVHVEFYEHD